MKNSDPSGKFLFCRFLTKPGSVLFLHLFLLLSPVQFYDTVPSRLVHADIWDDENSSIQEFDYDDLPELLILSSVHRHDPVQRHAAETSDNNISALITTAISQYNNEYFYFHTGIYLRCSQPARAGPSYGLF